ncbi:MAG: hypothetical protein FWD53_10920 [Phycisphaerales bacterium]|nr:hypothetical protein [Phycisphaerales bacterium]
MKRVLGLAATMMVVWSGVSCEEREQASHEVAKGELVVQLVDENGRLGEALKKQSLQMVPMSEGYSADLGPGDSADADGKVVIKGLAAGKHRFAIIGGWYGIGSEFKPAFVAYDVPASGLKTKTTLEKEVIPKGEENAKRDWSMEVKVREGRWLDVEISNNTDVAYSLRTGDFRLQSLDHVVYPPTSRQNVRAFVPVKGRGTLKLTLDWDEYYRKGLWMKLAGDMSWKGPTEDENGVYYRVVVGHYSSAPMGPFKEPPTQKAHYDDDGWGEAVEGLRAKVVLGNGRVYRSAAGLPVEIHVQNVSDQPIAYSRIWAGGDFDVKVSGSEERKWLRSMDQPPVHEEGSMLAAGQTLKWTTHLEHMGGSGTGNAGQTIELQPKLAVKGQWYTGEWDMPIFYFKAPAVTVKLADNFPTMIKASNIPEKWLANTTLTYHERGIWLGSTWLQVQGDGTARVIRSKSGTLDEKLPAGVHIAKLPPQQLESLAALLRKHEFKNWTQEIPTTRTCQNAYTVLVSVGGATVNSHFESQALEQKATLQTFQAAMREVILEVVKTSRKTQNAGGNE